jgi:hypothetical protein
VLWLVPIALPLAGALWWAVTYGPLRSPQAALADFYEPGFRAEDQLADPLVLAGPPVVPLVVEEIRRKDMPLRRYAIDFLGDRECSRALPALREILTSEDEDVYCRGEALQAIHAIDADLGGKAAESHAERPDYLGQIARELLDGSAWSSRRTFWQAFSGCHDCGM